MITMYFKTVDINRIKTFALIPHFVESRVKRTLWLSLNKISDHIFKVFDFGQLTSIVIVSCFAISETTIMEVREL